MKNLPEVLFVEANGTYTESLIPNDPSYQYQWYLNNQAYPGHDIHAQSAWDIFTGNPSSIIAIIDDGVDITQTDLSAKITGGDNTFFVEHDGSLLLSHGTAVAGAAAASTNNGTSIAGVDWNARILPEDTHDYNICFCLNFITKPHGWNLLTKKTLAAIDFNSNVWTLNHSYELSKGFLGTNYSVPLGEAFAYAAKNNRVSCVASGNDNSSSTYIYPANYGSELIDVGATDQLDHRTSFSNYGANLDVVAPGLGIEALNYTNFGSLVSVNGTSLSSPIVAGIASLLKGYNTNLYNDDIEQLIKLSADDQGVAGRDDLYGYGRVNASTALKYLNSPYQLTHLTSNGGTNYSSSDAFLIMLGTLGVSDGVFHVKKIEVRKTVTLPNNYCSITDVWGTGLKTTGWHDNVGYCYGDGFCEVVPGSQTATQVTLRTYVYQLYTSGGLLGGYYPRSPQNVTFAYTVLGIPAPTGISGDDIFCTPISNSYSLPNLPTGASVIWSIAPSGIATPNSPNATQTTLTKNNNGVVTLTATITSTCGTTTLNKMISVGVPPVTINGPSSICTCTCCNYYTATSIPGATYTWSVSPASGNSAGGNGNQAEVIITSACYLTVQATTLCGTSSATFHIFVKPAGQCHGGCSIAYTIAPNPAQNTITISLPNTQNKNEQINNTAGYSVSSIRLVSIYDASGKLIRQQKFNNSNTNQIQMDVSSLISGSYSVSILDGTINETQTVIIQR